uniref:Uncharacterized protein n=1 Tax=Acrobeloides nanus TaxID=290746 RepID=A0A914DYJ4_9BILA
MCGWTDPEDLPEEKDTLYGRELVIFCIIIVVTVLILTVMYEFIMPVINNPTYPFYNHVPDFTYKRSN